MTEPTSGAAAERSTYWCNFCGFKTADEAIYLSHSCTDELRRKGQAPSSDPPQNACR